MVTILQRGESRQAEPAFWSEVTGRTAPNRCPVIAQHTRKTYRPNTPQTWLARWKTALYFQAGTNAALPLSRFGGRQLRRGRRHRRAGVWRDRFRPVCLPVILLGPRMEQLVPHSVAVQTHTTCSEPLHCAFLQNKTAKSEVKPWEALIFNGRSVSFRSRG